jgi:hypothetical protein
MLLRRFVCFWRRADHHEPAVETWSRPAPAINSLLRGDCARLRQFPQPLQRCSRRLVRHVIGIKVKQPFAWQGKQLDLHCVVPEGPTLPELHVGMVGMVHGPPVSTHELQKGRCDIVYQYDTRPARIEACEHVPKGGHTTDVVGVMAVEDRGVRLSACRRQIP